MKKNTRVFGRLLVAACGWPAAVLFAQSPSGGVIEGRVANGANGAYLENARVSVDGTGLETLTNATGSYRIVNVPPGSTRVTVAYSGFRRVSQEVTVAPGGTVRQDFELQLATDASGQGGVVRLDPFTVNARQLSAEAAALNEQKIADNIKNVVTFDEFGDMGEGNPGEYLKYVPGVMVTMGPAIAVNASIRGFPAEGTLVTVDGSPIASSTGNRSFELTGAATGNIDRLEVTKSPTPDMPANAVGGGINIRGKSAFSVAKPVLDYSAFTTFNLLTKNSSNDLPGFDDRLGSGPRETLAPIQPGFDFTYLRPVNERFGFALSASRSNRYYDQDFNSAFWNLAQLVMYRNRKQDNIQLYEKSLGSVAVDWKVSDRGKVRLTTQYSTEDSMTSNTITDITYSPLAAPPPGDFDSTAGLPGRGTATSSTGGFNFYRSTVLSTFAFSHDGDIWKLDVNASLSRSWRRRDDLPHGFFTTYSANHTGLTINADGFFQIGQGLLPRITAADGAGQPVNVYDVSDMTINSASTFIQRIDNELKAVNVKLGREFATRIPLKVTIGGAVTEDMVDQIGAVNHLYTFSPPASAGPRTARNFGLINEAFSAAKKWRDIDGRRVNPKFIDPSKLYALYAEHPEYFVLNENSRHMSAVNTSKVITETISAAFLRFDVKLLQNRLRVTAGARYERTQDDAIGPLNDITRTYQRDASGNIVRNAAGAPVLVPGTALDRLRLQMIERGTATSREYDGIYPSWNATFAFTENLLLRGSYARTIARPDLPLIIPSMTLPDSGAATGTITLVNSGLTASTSNSYDLSLEYYGPAGMFASAGLFRKEMQDFISNIRTPADANWLQEYGIPDEYLGFDIATTVNLGDARVDGIELAWRQPLSFLPTWARGLSLFTNATFLVRNGTNAEDLNQFASRTINGGVSLVREKLRFKLNALYVGEVQLGRVAESAAVPPGTFRFNEPQTTVDLSADYQVFRHATLFLSVRNLLQDRKLTSIKNADTPSYAQANVHQRIGALWTVGIKGRF